MIFFSRSGKKHATCMGVGTGEPPAESRSAPHLALGRAGEEAARNFLVERGFFPVAVNWRPQGRERGLELDIIGDWDDVLVFVEVKSRRVLTPEWSGSSFEPDRNAAMSSFTPAKQRRMMRAARHFLSDGELWERNCRFDLVCVTFFPNGLRRVEHHVHVIDFDESLGSGNAAWQPW